VHGSTSHTGIVLECLTLRTSEAFENRRGGLELGRVTSERVLANLRESLPSRRPQSLAECRSLGRCSLGPHKAIPAAFIPELAVAM
jgi:hypothetical protein